MKFLARMDSAVPHEKGMTVYLVMDNYATHKVPAVKRGLLRHPRFVVRFFAEITGKRFPRGVCKTEKTLEKAIEVYLAGHNANPKPFRGSATAAPILCRVDEVCKRTFNSAHYVSVNQ